MSTKKYISIINQKGNSLYIKDSEARENKIDKVTNATSGNIASFNSNGNITDSGIASSNIAVLSNGKIPSSNLPSYVDDVIEGYYKTTDSKFYENKSGNTYSNEITGETGKIYVDLNKDKSYRWSGSMFVKIDSSDVTGIKIGSEGTTITPSEGIITIPAPQAAAGANINSVGTPSVSASTDSNGITTFTFNNLKGATGASGSNGTNGTSCTHSWSGTTLSVTSASGTSSADLKGAKGDDGDSIKAVQRTSGDGTAGTTDTYTMYSDTAKTNAIGTFTITNGANGSNGSNGSNGTNGTSAYWFTGTAVTGTGNNINASVSNSKAGDMYLNTSTYNVYKATAANKWGYVCNIKGTDGTNATTTSVFSSNANGLAPSTASGNQAAAETSQSGRYLCSDGKWRYLPTNAFNDTTYSVMGASGTNHASGLIPDTPSTAGDAKFLCENATWRNPLIKTIDFYPFVFGVNGISTFYSSQMIEGRIYYDYQNNVFYYISSASPVQFTSPTWSEFYINDEYESKTLLYSNGVITDVTQNIPYDIYICQWASYNAPGTVVYISLNSLTFDSSISFSNINSTSYDKEFLGLPLGVNYIQSLASIPATANVVVAVVSTNQSTVNIGGVSYNNGYPTFGDFTDGKELHVFVPNFLGVSSLTITLPTTLPYVLCEDDSALILNAGEIAEINFVSCSSQDIIFVKAVKSAMTYTI